MKIYNDKHRTILSNLIPYNIGVKLDRLLWKHKGISNSLLNDVLHGITSGIPLCCVFEFIRGNYNPNKPQKPFWIQYKPCNYCLNHKRFAHTKKDVNYPIKSVHSWQNRFINYNINKNLKKP